MNHLRSLFLIMGVAGVAAMWAISRTATPPPPALNDAETRNAALVAPTTSSLSPKTKVIVDGADGQTQGFEGTGVQARHTRIRSALENAPGYYPPADPESLAALTGRRDAPLVDAEFQGGASSLEELARSLIAGVQDKDERALQALRVARAEYETILWPEFPQSRPVTHIPFDEVWGFTTAQSLAGAGRTVGLYGGRPLTFLRVDYGHAMSFRNFTLYRDVKIVIRDARDGQVVALGFAPSVAERHGRHKVLIYKD